MAGDWDRWSASGVRGRKGMDVFESDEFDVRDDGRLGVELADEEARNGTPLLSSVVSKVCKKVVERETAMSEEMGEVEVAAERQLGHFELAVCVRPNWQVG